jgi:hypothetical protein
VSDVDRERNLQVLDIDLATVSADPLGQLSSAVLKVCGYCADIQLSPGEGATEFYIGENSLSEGNGRSPGKYLLLQVCMVEVDDRLRHAAPLILQLVGSSGGEIYRGLAYAFAGVSSKRSIWRVSRGCKNS